MPAFVSTAIASFKMILFSENEKAILHIEITFLYSDIFIVHIIEIGFLFSSMATIVKRPEMDFSL
jgi:hypothetical protein